MTYKAQGAVHKPSIVEAFEQLYDSQTGGYYFPEQWYVPQWVTEVRKEEAQNLRIDLKKNKPENLSYAAVELEVANFYYWLARMAGAKTILETGTNLGYSTSLLASALHDMGGGSIYTIDVQHHPFLFKDTPLGDYVKFLCGSSLEVEIPEVVFDMLVLDSDHSYFTIMNEVIRFDPYLRVGGLCLFHDTKYFDGIGLCVKQLMMSKRYEVVNLDSPRHHGNNTRCPGVTIARKILPTPSQQDLVFDERFRGVNINRDESRTALSAPLIDLEHPLVRGDEQSSS